MGLIILACLIAIVAVIAYRRRQLRLATRVPEWEAADQDKVETLRAIENIEQVESFLPEMKLESEVPSNKQTYC